MVSEGLITLQDLEDAVSTKGSRVINIGLPAYSLVRTLVRSAKADSAGLLLGKQSDFLFKHVLKENFWCIVLIVN
jgi:hypothetical protein